MFVQYFSDSIGVYVQIVTLLILPSKKLERGCRTGISLNRLTMCTLYYVFKESKIRKYIFASMKFVYKKKDTLKRPCIVRIVFFLV